MLGNILNYEITGRECVGYLSIHGVADNGLQHFFFDRY